MKIFWLFIKKDVCVLFERDLDRERESIQYIDTYLL